MVLCGGRGSRMGGIDKGLIAWLGTTLAEHALARLKPQVGTVLLSANRNREAYAALGATVLEDDDAAAFAGPLAGWLAALVHLSHTGAEPRGEWLASVPCDSPKFPTDLVERLAAALASSPGAQIAIAATLHGGQPQPEPVFALLHTSLRPALAEALHDSAERGVQRWALAQGAVLVPFDDTAAFANINTPQDLADPHA